jgi:homoserine kinase
VIWQQANLAGFLAGCYTSDIALIRESLLDVVIEPQRQVLIPGFVDVKKAALDAGALGGSISGAGPTVFAWAEARDAEAVRSGMVAAFRKHGLDSDAWVSAIDLEGARVVGD